MLVFPPAALSHCESCYQEFPDILLALHFMLGVGQMIWQSERRDGDVEQQVVYVLTQEPCLRHGFIQEVFFTVRIDSGFVYCMAQDLQWCYLVA